MPPCLCYCHGKTRQQVLRQGALWMAFRSNSCPDVTEILAGKMTATHHDHTNISMIFDRWSNESTSSWNTRKFVRKKYLRQGSARNGSAGS